MKYISTRGRAPALDFAGATLTGLASDGGLYVPAQWPRLSRDEITALHGLDYVETAVRVMRPFVADSLDDAALRALCRDAYGQFSHDAVTPLVQLDAQHWVLELFHGPTLAFKDVALQLLGRLFTTFLTDRQQHLTIVGATSGDTGSAAIAAVAGNPKIDIFMLHPLGRVSDVQRRQMTTIMAPNVHNIAIEGSFDDAQAIVKALFADAEMTSAFTLSAVNSINWARLMAQVVYYFYAAVRLGAPERPVAFSVPTGNFGDVFAGYVAAQMGLPIAKLVVATNVNDILARALTSGDYSQGVVTPTATPSMDIQVSSNFERLLFDAGGRDGAALAAQMQGFERTKAMQLTNMQREAAARLFTAARIDAAMMTEAMQWGYSRADQILDPHTAVGLAAARTLDVAADVPIVTLATAHPAKFPDALHEAIGLRPALPARVGALFELPERYVTRPATAAAIKDYVQSHGTRAAAR